MLQRKGFEIEIYTGTPLGEIVGFSDLITRDLKNFVTEPDNRNVEYITAPLKSYQDLLCALIEPRVRLRKYLQGLGDYTLIPGSTLSLGDSSHFYRSDPESAYHTYIEQTYGTKVVTASVHINIEVKDPELLMQACRLIRVEAPLYLALSAASPFLDNAVTGYHSSRWQMFPKTPQIVPLFMNHAHYINWTKEQLELGTMQNVRHLWSSVRPNGPDRPYDLNRLELRICDLVVDPISLLSITALLEARLVQMFENPSLDPLILSEFSPRELLKITDENEKLVSHNSLDATLTHWENGRAIRAKDWIDELYQEVWLTAKSRGFACFLSPLQKILKQGNQAQQWLKRYQSGLGIREIMIQGAQELEQQELELVDIICKPTVTCCSE